MLVCTYFPDYRSQVENTNTTENNTTENQSAVPDDFVDIENDV